MQFNQQLPRFLCTASALLTSVAVAVASSVYASHASAADLVGMARDQVGKPRAGVEIKLTGKDQRTSSTERRTTTTAAGEFAFPGIPPGLYDLTCDGGKSVDVPVVAGINRRDCP